MNIRHVTILVATYLGSMLPFSLSAAETGPTAISQEAPTFPYNELKSGCDGAVLAAFTITAKGDVVDASVVSSTMRAFDRPTLNALKKWKFAPATRGGVAVSTPICQLFVFIVEPHDPQTTTTRLVATLRTRNPRAVAASGWQPPIAYADGPIIASGERFCQARPGSGLDR